MRRGGRAGQTSSRRWYYRHPQSHSIVYAHRTTLPTVLLTSTPRRLRRTQARSCQGLIANRLFLSPKTIEFHLGRVYRKLGVRSRTELANALRETEESSRVVDAGSLIGVRRPADSLASDRLNREAFSVRERQRR